jgi:two-component system, OmpR family, response regulator
MGKQVVLVEDDEVIRENYAEILSYEGFDVTTFSNRADAMAYFSCKLPDIVLLDIGLNDERDGGFNLCTHLRRRSLQLPIIFLTSHGGDIDKISGLRLGADDYLTKDISTEYLVVRIEALLRRMESLTEANQKSIDSHPSALLTYGSLTIDQNKMLVYWKNFPVDLTLTQLWIIQDLAKTPGQAKTSDHLMSAANILVEPNTIAAHIKSIRDRFKAVDAEFNCIKTERGIGYRWVEL